MKRFLIVAILALAFFWAQPVQSQGLPVTGSITATGATCIPTTCALYQLPGTGTTGTVTLQVAGTFSATLTFYATVNGTDFVAINGSPVGSGSAASTTTGTGIWQFSAPGLAAIEVLATAYTSGTASVSLQASQLPTGGGGGGGSSGTQDVNLAQVAGGATAHVGTGVQKVAIVDSNGNPIQNSDIVTVYGATTADTTNSPSDCLVKSGTGTVNDTTNHNFCKASAGNLVGIEAISTSASIGFIKLYNLATDPTCSSATGFIRDIPIPAATTGAGIYLNYITSPEAFSTGIGYCITAAGGSTDNSAAPAGIYITFRYK